MKKFLSAILVVVLLMSLAVPAMAATKVYATGSVNLRKGPGLKYDTIGSVKKGTALTYKGSTSTDDRGVKWYKVSYKGKTAWISSRYASLGKKSGSSSNKPSTSSSNKVTATGSVNLRKGPGLKYAVIASVQKGSTLKYLGETKKDNRGVKWYKVSYDGKTAWISSKYSKVSGKSSSSSSKSSSSSSSSSKSSSSSSSSSKSSSGASAKQTVAPDSGADSVFSLDPAEGTADVVEAPKAPIVTEAPAGSIDVSGFYQAKLIETAIMLQIDGYQKLDTELPNQYFNDALTIAGDTHVDYIGLRGEGYTVYGVCVNMDIETAKGLLANAGLTQVDRDWVVGFEHPADENSSVNVNGYDSCINLYADTEGRITEIDWSTYTN